MQTKVGVGVRLRLGSGLIKADPNLNLTPTPTLVCVFMFTLPSFFFNSLFQLMISKSQIDVQPLSEPNINKPQPQP